MASGKSAGQPSGAPCALKIDNEVNFIGQCLVPSCDDFLDPVNLDVGITRFCQILKRGAGQPVDGNFPAACLTPGPGILAGGCSKDHIANTGSPYHDDFQGGNYFVWLFIQDENPQKVDIF